MNVSELIDALSLPPDARIDKKIPKKLLLENAVFASSDRKTIQETVEELFWIAALKPTSIGVMSFKDECREYLEIAVITVRLRSDSKVGKVALLIHRAVPYPVLLLIETSAGLYLSMAHKRWAQSSVEKFVVEDFELSKCLSPSRVRTFDAEFLRALSLAALPRTNLLTLYQGWFQTLDAYAAASLTGKFISPTSWHTGSNVKASLIQHSILSSELTSLKSKVSREKQLKRRVELNLKIKNYERELDALIKTLDGGLESLKDQ